MRDKNHKIILNEGQRIIDYRTQNGKFQTPEDLKNVPGIGEAKYNNLSGMITTK